MIVLKTSPSITKVTPVEQAKPNAAPCASAFSETALESRRVAEFGGVKVESGEVECNGDLYVLTKTTDTHGNVFVLKKKRA